MSDINTIVSQLEDALNIKLEKLESGTKLSGNSYTSYLSNLCLSHLHFEITVHFPVKELLTWK